jgi:hypothetical protein
MLVYYDISGKSKANEQFVKYTTDLFNRCRLEALLQKLCSAWKHWLSASRDGGAMIINDVKFIVADILNKFDSNYEVIIKYQSKNKSKQSVNIIEVFKI